MTGPSGGAGTTAGGSTTIGGAGMAGTSSGGTAGMGSGGADMGGAGPSGGGVGGQSSDTGGAGAGATEGPCPADEPCRILPLGDSITDGIGSSGGGYRVELFRLALEADKDITFVGGSANGPQQVDGVDFPRSHEGHSGWTVSQIDGIVPEPALGDDPHIVLLHIGTNDMYQSPSGAADRLDELMNQIVADNPESLLVVSTIIPFPQASGTVSSYNADLIEVVNAHIDAGEFVLFVDQFADFPTGELDDGVHPNDEGYARMARKWFDAIEPYLP